MASYSSAARATRRPARASPATASGSNVASDQDSMLTASGRPGLLHARKHSANTAGDVFGALSGMGARKDRGPSPAVVERDRPKPVTATTMMAEAESSTSSSSSPSTPPSSSLLVPSSDQQHPRLSASAKRFKTLYTRPQLLRLWSKERSTGVNLEHLYALCESPEQQRLELEKQDSSAAYAQRRTRPGQTDYAYAAPSGSGTVRRSLTSERFAGIQGGVLSGVGLGSRQTAAKVSDDDAAPSPVSERPLLGLGRGARLSTQSITSATDRERQTPTTPAWTSNRWRHLRDEDSGSASGSSNTDENEGDKESEQPQRHVVNEAAAPMGASALSGRWRPLEKDPIAAERPKFTLSSTSDANDSNSNSASSDAAALAQNGVDASNQSAIGARPAASLMWDDLLGPTPSPSTAARGLVFPSEAHPLATALSAGLNTRTPVIEQPRPVPTTLSQRLVTPLSLLNIGNDVSQAGISGPQAQTPTRRETVEGLEILARRSPVQEKSMAQLQMQMPQQPASRMHAPASRPESIEWCYRDPSGQVQGPFSAIQMQEWYKQRYFTESLLVRRIDATDYETLGGMIIRLGDAQTPFFSASQPRVFGPPGINIGHQPSITASPTLHRVASPMMWQQPQQHPYAPQPPSRSSSVNLRLNSSHGSGYSLPSRGEDLLGQLQGQHIQPEQAVPIDPWADTLPTSTSSPAISRSASVQAIAPDPLSALPNSIARSTDAVLPSPIGRSTSFKTLQQQLPASRSSEILANGNKASLTGAALSRPVEQTGLVNGESTGHDKPNEALIHHLNDQTDGDVVKSGKPAVAATPVTESKPSPALQSPKSIRAASKTGDAPQVTSAQHKLPVTGSMATPAVTSAPTASASRVPQGSDKGTLASLPATDKQKKAVHPKITSGTHELSSASLVNLSHDPINHAVNGRTAPWAKADESIPLASPSALPAGTLSLKEIQAKEEKEAAARKAVEKRQAALRLAAEETASAERLAKQATESLPVSSKWADSPITPVVSAPSPWARPAPKTTTTANAVKKTLSLKEIQEEEAKRKKAEAMQQNIAGQNANKAYASSAAKATAAGNNNVGWTTVGVPKIVSTAVPATVPSIPRPLVSQAAAAPPKAPLLTARGSESSLAAKADESVVPASPELLKWCKAALQGIDVSVDEFVQMLLSFPVPIDKGTRELIADSVYSSSRTLDGRHFAEAFADKRASDVRAIKAGKSIAAPTLAPPKVKNMAEALKFIPPQPVTPADFRIVKGKNKSKK